MALQARHLEALREIEGEEEEMIINGSAKHIPLADNSVDAVVTDPPYGIRFMGKRWDYELPSVETWAEVLRVLKPGGHLLSFGGARTYHRAVCRIEDAGFEIRDCLMWIYGSGFPKSLDVSKAIDKAAERIRGVRSGVAKDTYAQDAWSKQFKDSVLSSEPITDAAQQWQGWGTALKPAHEPIVLARKPLNGTVAMNVLEWGTGALNVDGCRIPAENGANLSGGYVSSKADGWDRPWKHNDLQITSAKERGALAACHAEQNGRWPSNLIHDGSNEVLAMFPDAPGQLWKSDDGQRPQANCYGKISLNGKGYQPREDSGSAARFFYCAKASAEERNEGLDHLPERTKVFNGQADESSEEMKDVEKRFTTKARNTHPTVKPLALIRYLCRLITPPGGIIMDPFLGSGSTGVAAIQEGFRVIGIEIEPAFIEIASGRLSHAVRNIEANPVLPFNEEVKPEQVGLFAGAA